MKKIFALFLLLILSGCTKNANLDNFAKCISDKGMIMYGAYWCPHCNNQKTLFSNSFQYVNYIECSLPNKAGQTQICIDAGIKKYPTWEFGDKTRSEGEMSLLQLSQKSGCPLN